ncbi:MAG: MotA/TolQ/ExbB proton channel family protein [Planctomycetaceae bacterium]|nr:MotA/TolQ/ExbB proton channel family protein [Planctomycetaceae bacterium]
MPPWSKDLLQECSRYATPVIIVAAGLHLLFFLWLTAWARRDLRRLAATFDAFTRGLKHRSLFDRGTDLSEQIDAFVADVRDVLDDPTKSADRHALFQRMQILDEERRYLHSHAFETWYNVARTMIEAYPLAGTMGAILAIGSALQMSPDDTRNTVTTIVRFFGEAIWSTFAGLIAAIILMFVNSVVETRFRRLGENRAHVREMVARTKRELSLAASAGDAA